MKMSSTNLFHVVLETHIILHYLIIPLLILTNKPLINCIMRQEKIMNKKIQLLSKASETALRNFTPELLL